MVHGWRALVSGMAALAVVAGAASAAAYQPEGDPPAAVPLVEAADCHEPTVPTTTPPADGSGATAVSFTVPATTALEVRDGEVLAAATNTGCAPRPGDTFVVGGRAATAGEIDDALATFTSGDWTAPGTWHPAG